MQTIAVTGLRKDYRIHEKREGLGGSLRGFFQRQYRQVQAVREISFAVERGEVVGFIGPNGAGKTTTLKMLTGLLHPSGGDARVLGYTPWERKKNYLMKIGFVMGQRNQLWWDLPAQDSFLLYREMYQIPDRTFRSRLEELADMLDVAHLIQVPIRNLSLGERMKCEVIGALLHQPGVLFLDEPTLGLDMISQKSSRQFIHEYNVRNDTTILLTSHYMGDITSLAQRLLIIHHGELVYDGALSGIHRWAESDKILKVQFATAPGDGLRRVPGLVLKEAKDDTYTFLVQRQDVMRVVAEIGQWSPIDFSVEDQPIEDVIEDLYKGGVVNADRAVSQSS